MKLSTKILLLAFLNLLLLGVFGLILAGQQLRGGWTAILLSPAQDRLLSVGRLFALEAGDPRFGTRDALLARYGERYGVNFHLFENGGGQLGGNAVQLPPIVMRHVQQRPPRRGEDRPPPPPARPPGQGMFYEHADDMYWIGLRIPIRDQVSGDNIPATLILSTPTLLGRALFFDWGRWALIATVILGISVLCWLPFIRGLTREIAQLNRATGQIAQGHFEVAIHSRRRDELGDLSESIEQLSKRLGEYVHGQKRFLGDIAHELSAPIARTQWALGILDRDIPDSQRDALADLGEEVEHMAHLVNELLMFSKAGIQQAKRSLSPVDVSAIAQRAIRREGMGLSTVRYVGAEQIMAEANEEYLFWSLSNLVRNAIRYAGEAGLITVNATVYEKQVIIEVSDEGPGLPASELEKVFAPFYRPDRARTRESGGAGLGLAIVKSCIETCNGTVTCRNRQPHGLTVKIALKASSTSPVPESQSRPDSTPAQ